MRDYDPAKSFDADSARYHDVRGDEEEAVAFLLSRAANRRSLELAIGTGRIAIPLAAAGLPIEGIDIAPAMLKRMREKRGGEAIPARLGDIVDVDVEGSFGFVFVLWNTFYNLTTQADQRRCFENVAARLDPGGLFLIEAYTPDPFFKLEGNQEIKTEAVGNSSVRIGALRHDPATQVIEQNHVTLSAEGCTSLRSCSVTSGRVRWISWPNSRDSASQSDLVAGGKNPSRRRVRCTYRSMRATSAG